MQNEIENIETKNSQLNLKNRRKKKHFKSSVTSPGYKGGVLGICVVSVVPKGHSILDPAGGGMEIDKNMAGGSGPKNVLRGPDRKMFSVVWKIFRRVVPKTFRGACVGINI